MALHATSKFPIKMYPCLLFLARRGMEIKHSRLKEEQKSYRARAASHFDDLYGTLFENKWASIRLALLSPAKKAILLNNLSDKTKILELLKHEAALNVRKVFLEQQKLTQSSKNKTVKRELSSEFTIGNKFDDIIKQTQQEDIHSLYPETSPSSNILENLLCKSSDKAFAKDDVCSSPGKEVSTDPTIDIALAESLKNADYDYSRLIIPSSSGITMGASLYEFIPATKLMGMDEYVPESAYYVEYSNAKDFPLNIKAEKSMNFPESLEIYAYERGNSSTFPSPHKDSSQVLDYHEFDLALLAPILALDIRPEDRVLDMCSSADSTLLIAQTFVPKIFASNSSRDRDAAYMLQFLGDYFNNILQDDSHILVTATPPMALSDSLAYNKILVGVPSINDRKSMCDDENSYFHPLKTKERVNIPQVQKNLLRKALELIDEGGSVVYFTQSLSPIQNEGVVLAALAEMWTSTSCKFIIKDMTESFHPLHQFLKIGNSDKCGHIVTPFLPNNYGPVYFCKIVKTFHSDS